MKSILRNGFWALKYFLLTFSLTFSLTYCLPSASTEVAVVASFIKFAVQITDQNDDQNMIKMMRFKLILNFYSIRFAPRTPRITVFYLQGEGR